MVPSGPGGPDGPYLERLRDAAEVLSGMIEAREQFEAEYVTGRVVVADLVTVGPLPSREAA